MTNIPKLRFKEFNNEWNRKKLDNIVTFNKGNLLSKSDLNSNGKNKCILYGQLYTTYHEVINEVYYSTNKSDNNIPRSRIGDVLIPSSGETPIDISTASCVMLDNILLGGDINILRPINADGRFLSYLISNNKKKEIAKVAQGHSIVHLYNENLKQINLYIPSIQEQTKIANMFELLDKKIELQSKKIEDLKLFKSYISNTIFCDSKILCPLKLNQLCIIKKGTQINGDMLLDKGKYYMLNGGINPSGYLNEYNTPSNTITISEGGNSCGYVNYNEENFWCGGHCYSLIPKGIDNLYLYYILKYNEKKIMKLRIGGGLPNIQKKDLENFVVYTHNDNEQKIISSYLTKFDNKINLEVDKLNKLKKLKKGLIQKMFI